MAEGVTPPTHVPVAGMLVPVEFVPRIVAAFRATYPTITGELGDDAACRAVLRYLVTHIVTAYEGQQVLADLATQERIENALREAEEAVEAARDKAKRDAAQIIEAPGIPIPPGVPQV